MSNVLPKAAFIRKQAEFSAYIRDPGNHPRPADVKKKRMEIYRELFFNNINSFLASNFPVLNTILDEQQWNDLVQDFFSRHPCETPYFSEIPEEFLDYLQNQRSNPHDFPFLLELAHYEWVEMALSISRETFIQGDHGFIASLPHQKIAISPLAWPLAYQFPVHRISPDYLPETTPDQPTCLVVYRDVGDEVHFMQINAFTFRLLQIIQTNEGVNSTGGLDMLISETVHTAPHLVREKGLHILQEMAQKGIIVPENG